MKRTIRAIIKKAIIRPKDEINKKRPKVHKSIRIKAEYNDYIVKNKLEFSSVLDTALDNYFKNVVNKK